MLIEELFEWLLVNIMIANEVSWFILLKIHVYFVHLFALWVLCCPLSQDSETGSLTVWQPPHLPVVQLSLSHSAPITFFSLSLSMFLSLSLPFSLSIFLSHTTSLLWTENSLPVFQFPLSSLFNSRLRTHMVSSVFSSCSLPLFCVFANSSQFLSSLFTNVCMFLLPSFQVYFPLFQKLFRYWFK